MPDTRSPPKSAILSAKYPETYQVTFAGTLEIWNTPGRRIESTILGPGLGISSVLSAADNVRPGYYFTFITFSNIADWSQIRLPSLFSFRHFRIWMILSDHLMSDQNSLTNWVINNVLACENIHRLIAWTQSEEPAPVPASGQMWSGQCRQIGFRMCSIYSGSG